MFLTHVQGVRASHVASGGDVAEMTSSVTQAQYYLVLWMNDGSKVSFSFESIRRLPMPTEKLS